ncbi:SgcJ/EcaC family oxidoreductase, partial [Sphingomonas sp.]|uniref:SgcJ/EcaC family oxidoreductase n=1 Tax=Sphingomonas sp. TaxID=28214 RepID=UPI001EB1C3F3
MSNRPEGCAMTPADLTRRFEAAWNAHDMDAFGRLFHADATFVNRFGTYWRGVEQIVAGHAGIHASVYSDSTLEIDAPDVD